MPVDQLSLFTFRTYNGFAPEQGSKALYLPLDFRTIVTPQEINIWQLETEARIEFVQAVQIDNTTSGVNFKITSDIGQASITLAAGKSCILPFLAAPETTFTATTFGAAAAELIKVHLLNFPVPAIVW